MIRWILGIIIPIIAIIFGISIYLQPDDLAKCAKSPSNITNCQAVDAVVAISGGDTAARAKEAINLYQNGWAKFIVFSGAAQDKTGPSNAAVMKEIALSEGVPSGNILIDEYSENTKQNAENTKTIFDEYNIKSVILVTSGYHQRRANLEFSNHNNDVKIMNHPEKTDKDWSFWWWVTPYGWWLAVSELAKIISFYVIGIL